MAEIVELHPICAAPQSLSWGGWLRLRLIQLRQRRARIGNADELPDRMRRDMGLPPSKQVPGRHYADYIACNGW